MRVAFDEHIPSALVRVLQSFSNERQFLKLTGGYTIERARDYAPKIDDADYLKGSDVPWIRRYAAAGGQVIISGDTNMMAEHHERLALLEERMIVCFFGSQWSGWKFYKKCALVINWWPAIVKTMTIAESSTFWRVPTSWQEGGELDALPTEDKKLTRMIRQRERQTKIAAERKARREASPADGQGTLKLAPREDTDE
ncbi:hypothetical protein [Methylobacterium oryzihabitans]|uniref:VapC45 PIN like domain-containing protein n=1 Tax=Methylobacterium oryzihabitans TaxID=2499852 RepID=A0A3S2VZ52_9HYPH|nr:hypothetical protein [Methylobacterium oryzihabitans]RVU21177.1 hypothetical protein EOE48_03520 [Methylobacterium oryzihabitans]